MRVICLVPSLTETLIDSGITVVGRTRFCIHPEQLVAGIPVVGGTKEINWEKCLHLNPDLVVMDREENTLAMAESCPFPWHATHIKSIQDVARELFELADLTQKDSLRTIAKDWLALESLPDTNTRSLSDLPGVINVIGKSEQIEQRVEYMIWREPWMAIGHGTFIHSVLKKIGLGDKVMDRQTSYPDLSAETFPVPNTTYLFSSEPFPFTRYQDELETLGINGAIVDGELYSWFGVRSLRLLSEVLTTGNQES